MSYQDDRDGDRRQVMTLTGEELLRRFLLHVLPTGFVRIRYYGLLANRYRTQNLKRCRALLGAIGQTAPPRAEAVEAPSADANERGRCPICSVGQLVHVGSVAPVPELERGALRPPTPRDTS